MSARTCPSLILEFLPNERNPSLLYSLRSSPHTFSSLAYCKRNDIIMMPDHDDFFGKNHQFFSWGKVTRKIVDPITFACYVDVTFVPRIEDCSNETTNFAISQPRFRETLADPGSNGSVPPNVILSTPDFAGNPQATEYNLKTEDSGTAGRAEDKASTGTGSKTTPSQKKNMVTAIKSGGSAASLGAFFSKASVEDKGDVDNQSTGSKSLSARSISDRSNAEISRAEMKLRTRRRSDSNMMAISEQLSVELGGGSPKAQRRKSDGIMLSLYQKCATGLDGGSSKAQLADFLDQFVVDKSSPTSSQPVANDLRPSPRPIVEGPKAVEEDIRSSPIPVVEERRSAERISVWNLKSSFKYEGRISLPKKLSFREDHDILEVPTLDDKEYYRDWEAIWYEEEELAEFRYVAFMEEAGLNVEDYV